MPQEEKEPPLKSLHHLDLRHIHLEDLDRAPLPRRQWGRWVLLAALLSTVLFIGWFPSTEFYRTSPNARTWFISLSGVALFVALVGGRWLWAWVEEVALQRAALAADKAPAPPRIISPLERWLTLLGAMGGLLTVVLTKEGAIGIPGQGAADQWWLLAIGALLSAGLGGRWLFLHANRPQKDRKEGRSLVLPPWVKWVNLGLLLAGGLFVIIGSQVLGQAGDIFNTSVFGAVGLVLGGFGAIWLSKRFDELEQHFKDTRDDQ